VQIFLVHPGGPFWYAKDLGAWSIPKGECAPHEDSLAAGKREFAEETGFSIDRECIPLIPRRQPSGKVVHAFAVEGDLDATAIQSNTFVLEWPPRSGQFEEFAEVDRAEWFPLPVARQKIHHVQLGFLDELAERLQSQST
jgi:predicted NUDIX family NTP pyrophosphohydrolase